MQGRTAIQTRGDSSLTSIVGSRRSDPLVVVPRSNDFVDDLLLPLSEVGADGAAAGVAWGRDRERERVRVRV